MAGFWSGDKFCMREFNAMREGGNQDGMEWSQSMAKISLSIELEGALSGVTQDQVQVQMSDVEIKVSVSGRPDLNNELSALNGDLLVPIDSAQSWWAVEDRGVPTLTIELTKKELATWSGVWHKGGMNPYRKRYFGFNSAQQERAMPEQKLSPKEAGRPTSGQQGDDEDGGGLSLFGGLRAYGGLCLEPTGGQSDTHLEICIPLEPEAVKRVIDKVQLTELFGLDLTETYLKVFVRDRDQKALFAGEFGGRISPQDTTWQIVKTQLPDSVEHVEALEISLTKASSSKFMWEDIIVEDLRHTMKRARPKKTPGQKRRAHNVQIINVRDLITKGQAMDH